MCDDPSSLEDTLRTLKRAELMHERLAGPDPVVAFKHALTQEVAYDGLLSTRKQALHEIAGRAIARLHAKRLEEQCEVLAHHFSRSSDAGKALDYLQMAVDKSMGRSAAAEAKTYFDEAMRLPNRGSISPATTACSDPTARTVRRSPGPVAPRQRPTQTTTLRPSGVGR